MCTRSFIKTIHTSFPTRSLKKIIPIPLSSRGAVRGDRHNLQIVTSRQFIHLLGYRALGTERNHSCGSGRSELRPLSKPALRCMFRCRPEVWIDRLLSGVSGLADTAFRLPFCRFLYFFSHSPSTMMAIFCFSSQHHLLTHSD